MVIVGVTIHVDSEDARNLARCLTRRLTGDPEADPPRLEPGNMPIRVLVPHEGDAWAFAERQRDECADELGIADPWKLVTLPRPE